ncbi:GntR family transcriptional regulator [Nonomuraea sp. NPDC051191]|uniref:GntR family transcriptional regulator n=1 Tax=Nonomuraea sp. NPDC051191 TaxID=3364372 RepID=UPI0037A70A98
MNELYDVRGSLEVLATRLAAEQCARGTSAEILDEAERAVDANDGVLLSATNSRFHAAILTLSDNQLLQDLMAPILGRVNRLFYIVPESDQVNFHHEHAELYRAISSGQAELAAALAFAHVEHSRRDTLPVVRSLLDGAPESPPGAAAEAAGAGGPASGRGEGLAGSGASEGRPPSGGGRVLPLAATTALWEEPGPW